MTNISYFLHMVLQATQYMYMEGPPPLRSYTPAAVKHMTVNHAYKYDLFY